MSSGVNTYKALMKDQRLCPGGGATEMELSLKVLILAKPSTLVLLIL